MTNPALTTVLSKLDVVRDAMSVKRVFGDPYRVNDTTIIPVAAVSGGGGGGGGSGPDSEGGGSGAGIGFGVNARPVGVFVVKDGTVSWRPAVDLLPIVLGAQAVAFAAVVALRRALRRRPRRHRGH